MKPLGEYVSERLFEQVRKHGVVVWYDVRRESEAFIRELSPDLPDGNARLIELAGHPVSLIEFTGSVFAVRAAAEPLIEGDSAPSLVVYVPGRPRDDRDETPLMELEKSGTTWEPQLKGLARNVLRQRRTDGVVDEVLNAEGVTYEDLAQLSAQGDGVEQISVLRALYGESSNDGLIADWIVSDEHDIEIEGKGAKVELLKLFIARLGADLTGGESLAKARAKLRRYVLANEFRLDLKGDAPASVAAVPHVAKTEHQTFVRQVARTLRREHGSAYPAVADAIQEELSLGTTAIDASKLGSIDTFRFEETALLRYCDDRIASGYWAEALDIVRERESSFWVARDIRRKSQWDACRAVAEVARLCAEARNAIDALPDVAKKWIDAYCAEDGLHRVDRAYRQMETLVSSMAEEVEIDRALNVVRAEYEDLLAEMARRFSSSFVASKWQVDGVLHQTDCYAKVVAQQPRLTAYFFVDAMRYEMGVALCDRLRELGESAVVPAIAALPTITPIGMAALLPGAESSFSVVEQKGTLGARIDGSFLPGVNERRKFLAARVPGVFDVTLDQLLRDSEAKLRKNVEGKTLVNVRSQEIDHAGESGFVAHARQMMDGVLNNLTRAIRRLAKAGVSCFVISADHGHQFSIERDESMRIDAPGGDTVDLHRRCWMGRGGKTPPGCARVAAADLGYDSDLDFIFPINLGIFKAGGDPSFHHGAITLQELIVPVVTLQWNATADEGAVSKDAISVSGIPEAITNRMPTVMIAQKQIGFAPLRVKPVLMAGQKQAGKAGVALNAVLDRENGIVTIGKESATVGIILDLEDVDSVRIMVLDAENDAILFQSADIPLKLGI